LLRRPVRCLKCRIKLGKSISLTLIKRDTALDGYVWRCKDKSCREERNIRIGNKLLEMFAKISLKTLLLYIFNHFCMMSPANTSRQALGIGFKTIHNLSSLLNDWILKQYLLEMNSQNKFGSYGSIVEFDESCFFKRKNNKGRVLNNIWTFGIIERDTGRLYVQVVEKKDAKTLLTIIQERVSLKASYVISDEWKAYGKLKSLKYNHVTVKHKKKLC